MDTPPEKWDPPRTRFGFLKPQSQWSESERRSYNEAQEEKARRDESLRRIRERKISDNQNLFDRKAAKIREILYDWAVANEWRTVAISTQDGIEEAKDDEGQCYRYRYRRWLLTGGKIDSTQRSTSPSGEPLGLTPRPIPFEISEIAFTGIMKVCAWPHLMVAI